MIPVFDYWVTKPRFEFDQCCTNGLAEHQNSLKSHIYIISNPIWLKHFSLTNCLLCWITCISKSLNAGKDFSCRMRIEWLLGRYLWKIEIYRRRVVSKFLVIIMMLIKKIVCDKFFLMLLSSSWPLVSFLSSICNRIELCLSDHFGKQMSSLKNIIILLIIVVKS